MKNIRRFITVLLAIVIFAFPLLSARVFAADEDMRYGRTKLTADQRAVYDALVNGCASAAAEISIDISRLNIDIEKDLQKTFTLFYSDYPEYFWVNGSWDAGYTDTTLVMKPHYSIPGGNLAAAKAKYDAKVTEITAGISGSDYQKAKTLHDRLIDRVTYIGTENDQNAYGALVEGKAICNGYARAYQHLMKQVGIPAWYVVGSSVNPATNTPIAHAWNLVKIDGQWYYTDVTWDDQVENTFYAYFHITTGQLLKDHTIQPEYAQWVPQATATAANYYKKEAREFTSYNQSKLVELLKKDGNKTQLRVDGDVDAFVASVSADILPIGKALGGTGAFQIAYRYSRLENALIMDVVLVSGESHTHSPKQVVQQVDATCLQNGTKAHYICDCGMIFSDQACTNQVVDSAALTIPASAHVPSGYQNNGADHWKQCTKCGSEIANSRGNHSDGNGDTQCDTCAYQLPVADTGNSDTDSETTQTTEATETTGSGSESNQVVTESTSQTENATQNTEQAATQSTQSAAQDATSQQPPAETESNGQEEASSAAEATSAGTDTAPNTQRSKVIWICCGGVAVAGAAAAAVILLKKKLKK